MNSSNKDQRNESKETTAGRATEKEETTNDSHKVNKGPDAAKVDGHDEGGRCTSATNTDLTHESDGE